MNFLENLYQELWVSEMCLFFLKDSVNAIDFVALVTFVLGTDIVLSLLIKYCLH